MTPTWSLRERREALDRAAAEGVDLLVIGGGITGAGVLRDAASRGLRCLLVERRDFAGGTSSRSSKLVHGGLRYIGEGHLGLTREACRERDLLLRQTPNLVRRLAFLLPSHRGGAMPLWQVHAAMFVYSALANFRKSSRFKILSPEGVHEFCPDLRRDGLRGGGVYFDAQVDDARLVVEALRSARAFGAEAVNHAEVVAFGRGADGRIASVTVKDHLGGGTFELRAHVFVNVTGPSVERVSGLDEPVTKPTLRPAKGVHIVIPRDRIPSQGAVGFEGVDRRMLFLMPWDEVAIIGTTDRFSDELDEPVVTIDEVHYLLSSVNGAFPRAAITTNDIRSVYAGVRPLVASPDDDVPSTSVSREHRIWESASGLLSAAGGKLTTFRAMGEAIVDRALPRLPEERRAAAGPSRTARVGLRDEDFDGVEFRAELAGRFGLSAARADHLVRAYGAAAEAVLAEAAPEHRAAIGASLYSYAEIPWLLRTECVVNLCDLLERRMRLAIFAVGQGISELDRIAAVAGEAAGWDAERVRVEAEQYLAAVRRRYQIQPSRPDADQSRSAAA